MREPTPEMIEAGAAAAHGESDWHRAADFTKVRHRDYVAPVIKAALAAAPSPWRPIAEAKDRDVPNALLCIAGEPDVFLGSSRNGVWCDELDMVEPTHFMEIPAPPESADE
ncbi:hypothetical protein GOB93_14100 [Acetobacter musti]|uniref:Uncharacterized protein n=1 Tax=Acetobacter musti TaxID=864732 RepID=A0ABX0JTA4_9PROT|nr:hypothetical protein [Acetobacter musti]NHN85765.1 hypothetical protein [Acetobacter musti]